MTRVVLDHAALARILKSREVDHAAEDLAGKIAEKVRGQGITVGDRDGGASEIDLPVKVYSSDAGVEVALAHAAGIAVQAKHGSLSRAAAELGLEIRG